MDSLRGKFPQGVRRHCDRRRTGCGGSLHGGRRDRPRRDAWARARLASTMIAEALLDLGGWCAVTPTSLCIPKTLYEASRVKRFFAINISSLPTFQEAQFCIDGTADSPAWRR